MPAGRSTACCEGAGVDRELEQARFRETDAASVCSRETSMESARGPVAAFALAAESLVWRAAPRGKRMTSPALTRARATRSELDHDDLRTRGRPVPGVVHRGSHSWLVRMHASEASELLFHTQPAHAHFLLLLEERHRFAPSFFCRPRQPELPPLQ